MTCPVSSIVSSSFSCLLAFGFKRRCNSTRGAGSAATRLNTPLFRQLIESRDAQFGALAGVRWAEGFVVREPVVRDSLMK